MAKYLGYKGPLWGEAQDLKGQLPKFKTSFIKRWMGKGKSKSQAEGMFSVLYGDWK